MAEANMGYLLMAQGKFADGLAAFRLAQEMGERSNSRESIGGPYNFAATQAGCGQGKDGDLQGANERAHLRGQAILWLRADLATWQAELGIDLVKASTGVLYEMGQWQRDTAFERVRGAAALAKLPEAQVARS